LFFSSVEVWAIPLNSALLIVLALTNGYIARSQRAERRGVDDLKRSLGLTKRKGKAPDTGERRRATDHEGRTHDRGRLSRSADKEA
jgi:hypothetical protein